VPLSSSPNHTPTSPPRTFVRAGTHAAVTAPRRPEARSPQPRALLRRAAHQGESMNRCLSKLARTRASNSGSRGSCCARDTSLGLCHRPPTEPARGVRPCLRPSRHLRRKKPLRDAEVAANGAITLGRVTPSSLRFNTDNAIVRFAGTSSPLPDSNRRPPPYHGGWGSAPGSEEKRVSCLGLLYSSAVAPCSLLFLEAPRAALRHLSVVPKTCPQIVVGRRIPARVGRSP
jgi:hypothetical protein